jgi:hypothetical protein
MAPRFLLSLLAGSVLVLGLGAPSLLAQEATPVLDPDAFSPVVTNPLFPLASIRQEVLEGEELDPESDELLAVRIEMVVLPETKTITGIEATVVEVREYENGELAERTLDYYAQHEDGTVYYLGEDVDMYEDGELVGHEGAWLAGDGKNQAGIYMPAHLEVGQTFEQERAPGVAEDRSTVTAVGETVETRAGTYRNCIVAEDFDPLSGGKGKKFYCPGVGIAREESQGYSVALVRVETSTEATPSAN